MGLAEIIFTRVYTPSIKYRQLPFYIESFSHFVAKEHYSVERADLDCYIVLYTVSGEGVLEYLGNEYKIGENQVIFIDCSIHHIYKTTSSKPWEFYFMLIGGVGVKAYYDILFANSYQTLEYFDDNIIKKFIDTMLYLDGKHSQQFELWACRQINDLLIQLSFINTDAINLEFVAAIEFVEKNYDKRISIDELAKVTNMSKYHFIRKFKTVYSETPYGYIMRVRVNKAKSLLSTTHLSVDEVSERVGFNDSNTFIRAFKNITKMTPNQYRNNHFKTINLI